MHETWKKVLAPEFKKDYFKALAEFVNTERRNFTVYPPEGEVFTAFKETSFDEARVVIVGQDPYHGPGQAHGLSFSVKPGIGVPPSLQNIFKEAAQDIGFQPPGHGCLLDWARQGVLLLNTVLTVRAHQPASHQGKGWETFTDAALKALYDKPCVFVLWGKQAREKERLVNPSLHHVITAPHPSPMSASSGFFGSRPFSKVNGLLKTMGLDPIDWQLKPV
jgi:uracil-DNA glycosylase